MHNHEHFDIEFNCFHKSNENMIDNMLALGWRSKHMEQLRQGVII